MSDTTKRLQQEISDLMEQRENLKVQLRVSTMDRASIQWHLVEAKCRMQDVKLLLERATIAGDTQLTDQKLMFKYKGD